MSIEKKYSLENDNSCNSTMSPRAHAMNSVPRFVKGKCETCSGEGFIGKERKPCAKCNRLIINEEKKET